MGLLKDFEIIPKKYRKVQFEASRADSIKDWLESIVMCENKMNL